jgi:uncharacterized protein (TIGR02246 family)
MSARPRSNATSPTRNPRPTSSGTGNRSIDLPPTVNGMSAMMRYMTTTTKADVTAVRTLYTNLLAAWNAADAEGFAAQFTDNGEVIGFDGSILTPRGEIESELRRIFNDHKTGTYVGIVRDVTALAADVALLRAVAGVVPAGSADLKPDLNSLQRLTAVRRDGQWRVALYHNTPAQFHGRPELVQHMTDELRRAREHPSA